MLTDDNRHFRLARIGIPVAVLLAGAAGCSGGSSAPGGSTAPPVVATTPAVRVSTNLSLPIQTYLLTPDQTTTVVRAQNLLVDQCLEQFGFTPPPPTQGGAPLGPLSMTDRRYGITDSAQPQIHGYHLPPDRDPGRFARPSTPPDPPAETLVLTGKNGTAPIPPGQTYNGRPIPNGGCVGQAQQRLSPTGTVGDSDLAQNINDESFGKSRTDPRVTAVFQSWSSCLAAKGYHATDPMTIADQFTGPTPTQQEIAVATADVACKDTTNLVGVWYAVDVAYQNQLIDQNAQALAQIKQNNDTQVRNATAALGAGR